MIDAELVLDPHALPLLPGQSRESGAPDGERGGEGWVRERAKVVSTAVVARTASSSRAAACWRLGRFGLAVAQAGRMRGNKLPAG